MLSWIAANYVEIAGAVLGLIFLYLEIKENVWLWPVGLISSIFYVLVFFSAKLYAEMGLQVYYVAISIYGWYKWLRGKDASHHQLPIVRITATLAVKVALAIVLFYIVVAYLLVCHSDSLVPYLDSVTASLSIVATWMLAKKILEQWWLWVIANFVSLCLLWWKGLYPSVVLYFFLTVMSVVGYFTWKKRMYEQTSER